MRHSEESQDTVAAGGAAPFVTTQWGQILQARDGPDAEGAAALASLCQAYWYPLYAFVRRQRHSAHDAQDLTQEFFARLLAGNFLDSVSPSKGRFRSFLLASMKHFLANEWDKSRAIKRGGGQPLVSIDEESAEGRYLVEPTDTLTPEKLFEKQWALALLARVLDRLRAEHLRSGKEGLFERLKGCLTGDKDFVGYADLAAQLKVSEGAVKVAVHRLRSRYRELLMAEISQTLTSPEEVQDELRHLLAALGG